MSVSPSRFDLSQKGALAHGLKTQKTKDSLLQILLEILNEQLLLFPLVAPVYVSHSRMVRVENLIYALMDRIVKLPIEGTKIEGSMRVSQKDKTAHLFKLVECHAKIIKFPLFALLTEYDNASALSQLSSSRLEKLALKGLKGAQEYIAKGYAKGSYGFPKDPKKLDELAKRGLQSAQDRVMSRFLDNLEKDEIRISLLLIQSLLYVKSTR